MAATRIAGTTSTTSSAPPPSGVPTRAEVMPKAQAENFTVASLLLSRAQRRALLGIYGFARLVDDIGDETTGDRAAMLDWLEDDVGRMFTAEPIHPLLRRLAPSARAHGFPKRAFLRLIAANRQDQDVSRYETYDELADYCDLSANPVGELVLYTFARGHARARRAVRLRLHRAAARGALAGRGRGLPPRPHLPPAGRPRALRRRGRGARRGAAERAPEGAARLRGRARPAPARPGHRARPLARRAARSSRSPATSAAGAPRSTRSSRRATTCSGARRRRRARRGRRRPFRSCVRRDELRLGLRVLPGHHAAGGGQLLLRHPPLAQGAPRRAVRDLRARAPRGRHRGRPGAARGEDPPSRRGAAQAGLDRHGLRRPGVRRPRATPSSASRSRSTRSAS